MYSQSHVLEEIEHSIPALGAELHTPECEQSIYKQLGVLSHYIEDKADDNELKEVKTSLNLVSSLYDSGNNIVKSAIENVVVFSFSRILMRAGENRKRLMALMPVTLMTIYMQQLIHRGC